MISKRIHRKKGKSDIGRLVRYIVDAKTKYTDTLWMTAEEFKTQERGDKSEKLSYFTITHCEATVPGMAIAEMKATQKKNTRSKIDKTYHMVISFQEGEIPTPDQMRDIEETVCLALGYKEHQRISAIHADTDNLHLHIAVNKIHPTTLKCLEPYNDYYIRDMACQGLEIKHQLIQDNHKKNKTRADKATTIDAFRGQQSLVAWIKENVKAAMLEAKTWQALHGVLAQYDLTIQLHGAGLVISQKNGDVNVKPSSIDRQLSIKALTDKLGAFESPSQITPVIAMNQYKKVHLPADSHTSHLYQQYLQMRQSLTDHKKESRHRLSKEYGDGNQKIRDWYKLKRKNIKENPLLTANEKRIAYKELYNQQQIERLEASQYFAHQRQLISRNNPALAWDDFLVQQAEAGNETALAVLRAKKKRSLVGKEYITASESKQLPPKEIIYPGIKHSINRQGERVYTATDGGRVIDQSLLLNVEKTSFNAVFIALDLARQRFHHRPLHIQGTDEFKKIVVEIAAKNFTEIRFSDEALEFSRKDKAKQYLILPSTKLIDKGHQR